MPNIDSELTVADVMQLVVKTVPSSMLLPELEAELLRSGISGCPVVDNNQLVGVVSRSDVVRQLCNERNIAEHVSDFHFDETHFYEQKMSSLKDIADRVGERIEGLKVKDVMVRNPFTTRLDQPLADLAKRFVDHKIHRMPVTDKGTLVGIVTTTDLVRLIANKRLVDSHTQNRS
jgi:CBS domain-containing protein